MAKSNKAVTTADNGKPSRGTAILLTRLAFIMMLGALVTTLLEKKVQGTRAANVKTG